MIEMIPWGVWESMRITESLRKSLGRQPTGEEYRAEVERIYPRLALPQHPSYSAKGEPG